MKTLLIPSQNFVAGRSEIYIPYGLLNLEAIGNSLGADVEVHLPSTAFLDSQFETSDQATQAILKEIDPFKYQVYGFSTVCNSVHYAVSVAKRIKDANPKALIAFGGPYVTKLSAQVLGAFDFLDAIFVGEAERTFEHFLETSRSKRSNPFDGLAGIHSRGSTFVPGQIVDCLDSLPFIDGSTTYFKWVESERTRIPDKTFVPLEATRGCPLKCSFCSTKQVWGPRVRRKSAKRLAEEMAGIEKRTGATFFSLIGDNVGTPRAHFLQFCSDFLQLETPYHWACSLKLDRILPEDLELMWRAGCRGMFVGVESGTQETLNRVNKAASLESEIRIIRLAIKRGFQIETSFIIGFPWENESDLKATYELHSEFLKLGVKRSQVGVLSPIPGTEIVADAEIVFDGSSTFFSDDGIRLSEEHRAMIECYPELFSHFGRYHTPNLTNHQLSAYLSASSQLSGLFKIARRRNGRTSDEAFAGRSAGMTS